MSWGESKSNSFVYIKKCLGLADASFWEED